MQRFDPQFHSTCGDRKIFLCYSLPPDQKLFSLVTLENSLPPRNEEVTDEGHEAFKVKESVNFIIRAFDPEHELSEAKKAFKDKLEIDTNNHNDKGITVHKLKFKREMSSEISGGTFE